MERKVKQWRRYLRDHNRIHERNKGKEQERSTQIDLLGNKVLDTCKDHINKNKRKWIKQESQQFNLSNHGIEGKKKPIPKYRGKEMSHTEYMYISEEGYKKLKYAIKKIYQIDLGTYEEYLNTKVIKC